jgi:hypothetical protein
MAAHSEVVLLQRICLGAGCHAVFWICPHCDRGHRYFSASCRTAARRRQRRNANRRHQQSDEGRLDHRDRQRDYRHRRKAARVTDPGSLPIASAASSQCGHDECEPASTSAYAPLRWGHRNAGRQPDGWLCCQVCGRVGRFVNPYPRIPKRR